MKKKVKKQTVNVKYERDSKLFKTTIYKIILIIISTCLL